MADSSGGDRSSRDAHHLDLIAAALRQHEACAAPSSTESVTLDSPGSSFTLPPPDSFTGYQIVREIHRGGQGVVFQALQKSTRRKVAIKVMREGPFAGASDRARFDREVQILGQLKHPNIVTIHDTGVAAGCHFFVMDYISGQPLDVHMASGPRGIDGTLRLFAHICDAVNAAHLRGIIHRDLKPGNIRIDNDGQPHVLDFGLAKVAVPLHTQPPSAGAAVGLQPMTITGQFIGSLPWASPEQAEGAPDKIDIRTDVYSLGVILYQMLTSKFPYEVVGNMRDVLDRIIRSEPTRPREIRREINDEVETIVLKCLSKERERRYQSAGELGRDVERYLRGEPIEAKRDSLGYLLGKQVRRHKAPILLGVGFILLLTAGLISSLILWRQAESARRGEQQQFQIAQKAFEASEQARAAEKEQRMQVERQRSTLLGTVTFLEDLLSQVGPAKSLGRDTTLLRELMDRAAQSLSEQQLKDQPEVEFRLRLTIGDTYRQIGELVRAREMIQPALDLAVGPLADDRAHSARALIRHQRLLIDENKLQDALVAAQEALRLFSNLPNVDHEEFAEAYYAVGRCLERLGRHSEALREYRTSLAMLQKLFPGDHRYVARSLGGVATCLEQTGYPDQALPLFEQVLAMFQRLNPGDHPNTIRGLNNLAYCLEWLNRRDEALPKYKAALEMAQRLYHADHPDLAYNAFTLGDCLRAMGRYEQALPYFEQSLAIRRRLAPQAGLDVAEVANALAVSLQQLGRPADALPHLESAVQILRAALPHHLNTLAAELNLAQVLTTVNRFREAEAALLPAAESLKASPPSPVATSLTGIAAHRAVRLYDAWHIAEPDKGYDAKAAEWRARLAEWQASTQPSAASTQPGATSPSPPLHP